MKTRCIIVVLVFLSLISSCGRQENNNQSVSIEELPEQSRTTIEESHESNVANYLKDWRADNPDCTAADYLKIPDYGVKHKLYVRKYSERPDIEDYMQCRDSYDSITIGKYLVFSRWRGPVYAYDKQEEKYFLVWNDLLHYNTKAVVDVQEDYGKNWISIIYVEDLNGESDVILYNLETNQYFFERVDFGSEEDSGSEEDFDDDVEIRWANPWL